MEKVCCDHMHWYYEIYHHTQCVCCVSEFVPVIEQLFDEKVLIGSGWTTHDSLRLVPVLELTGFYNS